MVIRVVQPSILHGITISLRGNLAVTRAFWPLFARNINMDAKCLCSVLSAYIFSPYINLYNTSPKTVQKLILISYNGVNVYLKLYSSTIMLYNVHIFSIFILELRKIRNRINSFESYLLRWHRENHVCVRSRRYCWKIKSFPLKFQYFRENRKYSFRIHRRLLKGFRCTFFSFSKNIGLAGNRNRVCGEAFASSFLSFISLFPFFSVSFSVEEVFLDADLLPYCGKALLPDKGFLIEIFPNRGIVQLRRCLST